jgi:sulfatase modifying factor 1
VICARSLVAVALAVGALGIACVPRTPVDPASPAASAGAPADVAASDAPPAGVTEPATPPLEPPAGAAPTAPPEAAPAAASTVAVGKEAPPDPACPADAILVDGTYCSDVEHTCLTSWYDKSNKKEVCEEFAPKATCTGSKVKKRYCIDRFAWPNVRGERPEVMNNFYQAQVKCAAVGKRICTESEWTMACEGPRMLPFPYGWKRDTTKCNGDHTWDGPRMRQVAKRDPKELARLWRGVPNGGQPECVSEYGVPDLPGNTDDIAASEQSGSDWKAKYDSVVLGGPWYKGVRNQCRPRIYTHDEGFYYYNLGFRCCAEADGKATDPRTPRQRSEDWKLSRVESLARFSVAEMKEKLEQKKRGACTCKPAGGTADVLCKTMCGTLLGPDAKDADLKAPRE